jgi:polyribonucleotide nucleotidyltransferase
VIDRTLRPLFADGFRNEVQVVNTVLSVDYDRTPEMTAMFGASLALGVSNIPFNGPIAGVQVGRVNGEYIVNPTQAEMEKSDIDLTVAGTKDAINMVEAGAKEVDEASMLEAMLFGHEFIKQLCAFQDEITQAIGTPKMEVKLYAHSEELVNEVKAYAEARLVEAVRIKEKLERYGKIDEIEAETYAYFETKEYASESVKSKTLKQVKEITHDIVATEVRRLISIDKIRPDGRSINELRALNSQVDLLPRVHGSALFTRGETQVLSVCTLGALGDNQIIDDLTEVEFKRFMHHYNFPPYSVGETGRMGSPGRREIGHGALGERALLQVLPSEDAFPYAVRLVAETLESNGSSSQASICAGTMALMAAGVPIKAPVAGIAMGLVTFGEHYTVLTDIQGMEDHFGDMDFKVAGTRDGITAIQMDIKIKGISREILTRALEQARKGRMYILDKMDETLREPRAELSPYAPRIITFTIHPDKIREVIGSGGKVINKIIADTGVKIDIEDDGTVYIASPDSAAAAEAKRIIDGIVKEIEVGDVYLGSVVGIKEFGAFINLKPGTDGLLHISRIANKRVEKVEDVLSMGEQVLVRVIDIDPKTSKISLTRKDMLPPEKE